MKNEDEDSGIKDSDSDAKRPRIAEDNDDNDDVVTSSPRRSSSSSNLRRSSRISQRTEKIGATGSTVNLNNCDASISVDNSKGQRNESDAPEVLDGTRSRVITEIIFSQNIQGGSSAPNPVSAQPSPTLQKLPKSVQKKLMSYLDINSLQNLSETCIFYDKYINGQFQLSIKFPFDTEFLSELQSSKTIVKKHLLRLTMNHIRKFFASHGGKVHATDEQLRYLIRSQLMLLQTDKLREICTAPVRDTGLDEWNWNRDLEAIKEFSPFTLHELFHTRSLRNVTKFNMILGLPMHPVELHTLLPNLEELSVLASAPTDGYR